MKRIEVAVGIIFNTAGQVLVGQRLVVDQYFGKWEFPGGKIEAGESVTKALRRELHEELKIELEHSQDFMILEHNYPDRNVRLFIQIVNQYSGLPQGAEGQALQWCKLTELDQLDFLSGNQPIIDKLIGEQARHRVRSLDSQE
ncbi:MAG: 8-oxo-dGTP diphosphatase [Polaribacter sp.]|jgi:8-oxo-dGTP diphosphatase